MGWFAILLVPVAGAAVAAVTSARRWWDRYLSIASGTPGRQCEDRTDYGMDR